MHLALGSRERSAGRVLDTIIDRAASPKTNSINAADGEVFAADRSSDNRTLAPAVEEFVTGRGNLLR
jgi:hypothetical protein